MPRVFTMPALAKHLGCEYWQLRRLFQDGELKEPLRIGLTRVISANDVPRIRRLLIRRGYLEDSVGA